MGALSAAILSGLIVAAPAVALGFLAGMRYAAGRKSVRHRLFDADQARTHRARLTDKLLELETITVDDIMIPRGEIANIDISDDWDTILDVLRSTPHTRLPVCRGDLDNIVGILHMKKVAHALARGDFTRVRRCWISRASARPTSFPKARPSTSSC